MAAVTFSSTTLEKAVPGVFRDSAVQRSVSSTRLVGILKSSGRLSVFVIDAGN